MQYEKPFATFDDQVDLLLSRGMQGDKAVIRDHLVDVGYYRLSGYWHIFKQEDNSFKPETTFEKVWNIYTFDRQLRLIVLDAVERVEVYFRTQLAYELAKNTGPFGFLEQENLPRLNNQKYEKFIEKCKGKVSFSREPFIVHFRDKYGDSHDLPPYWMLVNTMDFGRMLTLYKGASVQIRNKLAKDLGLSARVLESWLVSLNTVRNICAHHGRLWNRVAGNRPMVPRDNRWHIPFEVSPDRLFCALTILSYLLENIAPNTAWRRRLFELFAEYPDIDKRMMGFVEGWEECPLWKPWIRDACHF